MSIKYELVIYWSEEDQSFVVEVPELPGCMADGETYEEAVVNVRQVIEEWIQTARELGRPVPDYSRYCCRACKPRSSQSERSRCMDYVHAAMGSNWLRFGRTVFSKAKRT